MMFRLFPVFVAAMLFFPFAFAAVAAVAANNSLNVPVNVYNVSDPDLVQIAYSALPEEGRMPRKWQGEATIEVYMGSDFVNNVGYVTGSKLYHVIQQSLRKDCPHRFFIFPKHKCAGDWWSFPTRYREDSGKVTGTTNQIHVIHSYFENEQIRNLLIGSLAAAYEASTTLDRNCYYARDEEAGNRYCNVPLKVGAYTEDSHIYMELTSDILNDNDGLWKCCETRDFVDARLDELMGEFKSVYPTPRGRNRFVACHLGCREDQREWNVDVDEALVQLKITGM